MKTPYLIPFIILITVLAIAGWFLSQNIISKGDSTSTTIVQMKENSFEPETITIKKGTKVTFKNDDKVVRWPASNLHPTHGIYPEFDPRKPIESGEVWEFTFNKVGSWKYHDHLIPSIRGMIIVTD